jgi:hypothetical protein
VRHHVFALRAPAAGVRACEGQTLEWFDLGALPADRARVVSRSLTWIDDGPAGPAGPAGPER